MSKIRSLLAATDFSAGADRAVRRAALLAEALGARLELLHVVSESSLASLGRLPSLGDVGRRLLEDAQRKMDAVAASLPKAVARVEIGPLPERIVESAAAHDLLVLGAQGASSTEEPFLGTTAGRLLLGAKTASLVVRSEPDGGYARVLVPCEYAPPARRALEFALAVAPRARITLMHASDALDTLVSWAGKGDDIGSFRDAVATETHAWLSGLTRGLEGVASVETRVEFRNPRSAILAVAQDMEPDLIVMGKQGRSKIREMFLGSATRQVLDQAKCDVLVAASS